MGLPVGSHVLLMAEIGNELVSRPYTPLAPVGDSEQRASHLDLLIKVYKPNEQQRGGKMSMYLNDRSIGDLIRVKGSACCVVSNVLNL